MTGEVPLGGPGVKWRQMSSRPSPADRRRVRRTAAASDTHRTSSVNI
jgi:hypothetical protein